MMQCSPFYTSAKHDYQPAQLSTACCCLIFDCDDDLVAVRGSLLDERCWERRTLLLAKALSKSKGRLAFHIALQQPPETAKTIALRRLAAHSKKQPSACTKLVVLTTKKKTGLVCPGSV
jgi:hypothetical protein